MSMYTQVDFYSTRTYIEYLVINPRRYYYLRNHPQALYINKRIIIIIYPALI